MSFEAMLLSLALVVLVIVLIVTIQQGAGGLPSIGFKYQYKPLLNDREQAFVAKLRDAFPDFVIAPKVALAAFLTTKAPRIRWTSGPSKTQRAAMGALAHKHAAFVLCAPETFEVLAVLELDGAGTQRKDKETSSRDIGIMSAGIPTIRYAEDEPMTPQSMRRTVLDVVTSVREKQSGAARRKS